MKRLMLVLGLVIGLAAFSYPHATVTVPDGTFGGTVVATTSGGPTDNAWINVRCYQQDSLVFADSRDLQSDGTAVLQLGPSNAWQGGDADCAADYVWRDLRPSGWGYRNRVLASTTFHVDG